MNDIIDGLEVIAKRRGEKIQQGDVLIVEAAIKALKSRRGRASALQDALVLIDSWMPRGDLGGNGCDKNAQRGGMVLAYNLVFGMRDGHQHEAIEAGGKITGISVQSASAEPVAWVSETDLKAAKWGRCSNATLSARADTLAVVPLYRSPVAEGGKPNINATRYEWLRQHYKFANDSMRELWFDPKNQHHSGQHAKELDDEIDRAMAEGYGDPVVRRGPLPQKRQCAECQAPDICEANKSCGFSS